MFSPPGYVPFAIPQQTYKRLVCKDFSCFWIIAQVPWIVNENTRFFLTIYNIFLIFVIFYKTSQFVPSQTSFFYRMEFFSIFLVHLRCSILRFCPFYVYTQHKEQPRTKSGAIYYCYSFLCSFRLVIRRETTTVTRAAKNIFYSSRHICAYSHWPERKLLFKSFGFALIKIG